MKQFLKNQDKRQVPEKEALMKQFLRGFEALNKIERCIEISNQKIHC